MSDYCPDCGCKHGCLCGDETPPIKAESSFAAPTGLAGQRRKGTRAVWVAVREARDADGWRVIIARDENSRDETDFGITEWQSMPLAS